MVFTTRGSRAARNSFRGAYPWWPCSAFMLSTHAVFALAVVLVLCLARSSEHGQAVRPERSHLLLQNDGRVDSVAFSPDGHRLAWSKWNRTVATLTWFAGDRLGITSDSLLDCGGIGTYLAFSSDGSLLAVGLPDGRLVLWDTRSWSARSLKIAQGLLVQSAAFAPDGTVMAASDLADQSPRQGPEGRAREGTLQPAQQRRRQRPGNDNRPDAGQYQERRPQQQSEQPAYPCPGPGPRANELARADEPDRLLLHLEVAPHDGHFIPRDSFLDQPPRGLLG